MYLGQCCIILHLGHIPNTCNVFFMCDFSLDILCGGGACGCVCTKNLKDKLDWILKTGSKNLSVATAILA